MEQEGPKKCPSPAHPRQPYDILFDIQKLITGSPCVGGGIFLGIPNDVKKDTIDDLVGQRVDVRGREETRDPAHMPPVDRTH